jgi:hypothetical protein
VGAPRQPELRRKKKPLHRKTTAQQAAIAALPFRESSGVVACVTSDVDDETDPAATARAPARHRAPDLRSEPRHYGRNKIPRVSFASPSAKNRALGKENPPRVLHSGKNCTRRREASPSAIEPMPLGEERTQKRKICI